MPTNKRRDAKQNVMQHINTSLNPLRLISQLKILKKVGINVLLKT